MTSSSTSHAATMTAAPLDASASFDHCRAVTRARAKNFYYGMMLTPEPKRSAMYAIYAWMRAVDDLGDKPGDEEVITRRLESFRRRTHAVTRGDEVDDESAFAAMWPAVGETFRRFDIPLRYLDAMLDGQLLDQRKTRYETFDELYDYCFKVASVVGLICIEVWGYEGGEATQQLAEQRGVALQLTNILRDLVEDARRNRVYLPAEVLREHGFDAEMFKRFLLDGEANDGGARCAFDGLMDSLLARTRNYYERSRSLESNITASCRPTCWAMMRIYEGLLRKMERRPRRVLTQRVRMSCLEKLLIAMRATLRRGLRT